MPSAPYCTHGDVYMMRLYMHDPAATEFSAVGVPNAAAITYWISLIASQMDMLYSMAGYEIPLTAMTGETWPTFQTTFLQYFNAIGVAALIGTDITSPPVAMFTRSGMRAELNMFEAEWRRLCDAVRAITSYQRSDALLRAATLVGTPADYMLSDGSPPLSDFLEGYQDPTRYDTLRDFTKRWQYYAEAVLEDNAPSSSTPDSIEFLQLVHARLGYTWDQDVSVT